MSLTVREVIGRSTFRAASLVAGEKGLDRVVRWAHIVEVADVDTLIHGGELILTTGLGLDGLAKQRFLENLISHGAAGLCVELGPYFNEVPNEMISLANEHDFPMIVFRETVRFVDITQDLHTQIINSHHDQLRELERISRMFVQLTLSSHTLQPILKALHHESHGQVVYIPENGKANFFPIPQASQLEQLLQLMERVDRNGDEKACVAVQEVGVHGYAWGKLGLVKSAAIEQFDRLILDRATLALAQILLRMKVAEERKQHHESTIATKLLHGEKVSHEDLEGLFGRFSHDHSFRVCMIRFVEIDWQEDTLLHWSMMVRTLFKQSGFHPYISSSYKMISVILFSPNLNEKERVEEICCQLKRMSSFQGAIRIGVSRIYSDLTQVAVGGQEAKAAIQLAPQISGTPFYEHAGVYRLFTPGGSNPEQLRHFIDDTIGALIRYDSKKGGELVKTMSVLLECDGSKKEAAERLFIVRQTLYHRLEKISQLLGEDFLKPERRLAIEIALHAHRFLGNKG